MPAARLPAAFERLVDRVSTSRVPGAARSDAVVVTAWPWLATACAASPCSPPPCRAVTPPPHLPVVPRRVPCACATHDGARARRQLFIRLTGGADFRQLTAPATSPRRARVRHRRHRHPVGLLPWQHGHACSVGVNTNAQHAGSAARGLHSTHRPCYGPRRCSCAANDRAEIGLRIGARDAWWRRWHPTSPSVRLANSASVWWQASHAQRPAPGAACPSTDICATAEIRRAKMCTHWDVPAASRGLPVGTCDHVQRRWHHRAQ